MNLPSKSSLTETSAINTGSRAPFVLVPQYFGGLVFDRQAVRYLPFDVEMTEILVALTQRPIQQIVAEASSESVREQLQGFYFHFNRLGLFDENGMAQLDILDIVPPADFLAAPLVAHVEVIGACNITCKHCFAGTLPRNQNPLSLNELDQLFSELAAQGCFRVSLTGGEPLMRNDIFEVIDSATDHGMAVALVTNGMMIDQPMAIELGRRKSLRLTVSLDGATAETNDAIRGAGVFEEVCNKTAILRKHASFAIGFTITKACLGEIDQCVQLARRLGARAAVFRPLYPTGTALDHPDLVPTFEEYSNAVNQVVGFGDTSLEEDVNDFESQCGAGELLAGISVQGDVNPCSFMGADFVSGNIREKSFQEIWNTGHQFQQLRNGDESSECESGFQGGCRCRSLASSGDAHGADPWHSQFLSNPSQFSFPLKNLVAIGGKDG